MKKRVIILGSTGSIGLSTLSVLEDLRPDFEVVGLAACKSGKVVAEQARYWSPKAVAIIDDQAAGDVQAAGQGNWDVFTGPQALTQLVDSVECDIVVAAVVGAAGLPAVFRAVELGRRVALANKEPMVVGGALLLPLAKKSGAEILPVDSEHSGVFQAMLAGRREEIRKVYLTASGGPFRTWSSEQMKMATLENALNHPTWKMGPKITIDSATLMNKALEIIEAHWLFGFEADQIGVLIHPESVIHALVEYADGSVIAQMGAPDMRTPIQYALTYPERRPCSAAQLDFATLSRLNFEPPDLGRFPAIRLAYEVLKQGGLAGAILNAANEAAVSLFRNGDIGFSEIVERTEQVLVRHEPMANPTLDDLLAADRWAREEVSRCMSC